VLGATALGLFRGTVIDGITPHRRPIRIESFRKTFEFTLRSHCRNKDADGLRDARETECMREHTITPILFGHPPKSNGPGNGESKSENWTDRTPRPKRKCAGASAPVSLPHVIRGTEPIAPARLPTSPRTLAFAEKLGRNYGFCPYS